jgi:hypothetical protein
MGESFIDGFCKVEFLCYHGEPNWLGWAVLIPAGVVGLIVALIFLGYILGLLVTANTPTKEERIMEYNKQVELQKLVTANTPERTTKEERIMEYNKQVELQKGDKTVVWKILLFVVLGLMALIYIDNLISG